MRVGNGVKDGYKRARRFCFRRRRTCSVSRLVHSTRESAGSTTRRSPVGEGVNTSRRPRGMVRASRLIRTPTRRGGEGAGSAGFHTRGSCRLVRGAQVARRSREVDLVLESRDASRWCWREARRADAGGGAAAQALYAQSGGGDVCSVGLGEESSGLARVAARGRRRAGGDRGDSRTRAAPGADALPRFESASRAGGVVNTAPSTTFGEAARGSDARPPRFGGKGRAHGRVRGRARALARRGTHARVARVLFARSRGRRPWQEPGRGRVRTADSPINQRGGKHVARTGRDERTEVLL